MDPISRLLSRSGPLRAGVLQRELGLTQSTFQRMAAGRDDLLVTGRARATTYALRRALDALPTPLAVYEVQPDGSTPLALILHPVEPFGFYVESHLPTVQGGFFESDPRDTGPDSQVDLPWFLLDLKPEGFLGRLALQELGEEDYPTTLTRWSGEHVLRFAARDATHATGAFVVGAFARGALLRGPRVPPLPPQDLAAGYEALVQRVMREGTWGSSPGGEQPKLATAILDESGATHQVIVKFSPPRDTAAGQRWADLLVVEHLVHELLAERGVAAARSRVLHGDTRSFLELERFDRVGTSGRRGLVSLYALDRHGLAGELRSWSAGTAPLVRQGVLSKAEHEQVCWLEHFGHAIANSDMHPGNLSFFLRGTTIDGLAPTYDMLPMAHAPTLTGELFDRVYPSGPRDAAPRDARDAASELWARVAAHPDISPEYKELAAAQASTLRTESP